MIFAAVLAASLAAAAKPAPAFDVQILFQRQNVVWGFDFLPDGRIILTERRGQILVLDPRTGSVLELAGAPDVWAQGQGGLLDVRVDPRPSDQPRIYLTWSQPVDGGAATALGHGTVVGGKLEALRTLLVTDASGESGEHFGSRVEFQGGHLFMTVGERGRRELAQDLRRHNGKILRLTLDGKPAGAKIPGALPEIWSWGHRNPQGLAVRPSRGELWSAEFGPRGGDELNLIRRGRNYGWPVVTYGREYWGPRIGVESKTGMEQPVAHWTPSISPSGMAFYDGAAFPKWRGSLFLACLSGRRLQRVSFKGASVAAQESLLADKGWRFRHVRQGPDGLLYFSTDEGKLGRLVPPGTIPPPHSYE